MTNDELARTLEDLHQQLQEHPTLDPPTVESVRALLSEIDGVLNNKSEPPQAADADLGQRWRATIEQFEGEHPKLTVALSQISEFLANIGI